MVALSIILLLPNFLHPINGDWVDPDTPSEAHSISALTKGDDREYRLVSERTDLLGVGVGGLVVFLQSIGKKYLTRASLLLFFRFSQVFSDEFEQDGRNFADGNDPRWTAINKNDCKCRKRLAVS
jgi:hypothetical protein